MGRPRRIAAGGVVYHVLNRANARLRAFFDDGDYLAFETILGQAVERQNMRLLAYVLMPNHWHLVVWPREDGDLSEFVGWLTLTHTQRWHAFRRNVGTGHLYQGRFKSFPVQEDQHLRVLCRYVERNPLRKGLVDRAQDWQWSSLWRRCQKNKEACEWLADWPIDRGHNWLGYVNTARTPAEAADEKLIADSFSRGRPFGSPEWQNSVAQKLGLQATLRPIGRPKKQLS